jgi:hypothetical protein
VKLATLRTAEGTRAIRVQGERYAEFGATTVSPRWTSMTCLRIWCGPSSTTH